MDNIEDAEVESVELLADLIDEDELTEPIEIVKVPSDRAFVVQKKNNTRSARMALMEIGDIKLEDLGDEASLSTSAKSQTPKTPKTPKSRLEAAVIRDAEIEAQDDLDATDDILNEMFARGDKTEITQDEIRHDRAIQRSKLEQAMLRDSELVKTSQNSQPHASIKTNTDNLTLAPFMNFHLVDLAPESPNPGQVTAMLWRRIAETLDNANFRKLSTVCRFFRQLLEPMRPARLSSLVKSNNQASAILVIKNDMVDLLEVMQQRGDIPDVAIAMVHALHHRAIRCIAFLNTIPHELRTALDSIFEVDDVDVLKIALHQGADIQSDDIRNIMYHDAIRVFSYLVQLTNPRQLLSIELQRDPESLRKLMLLAGTCVAVKIVDYLRSLGVPYYFPSAAELEAVDKHNETLGLNTTTSGAFTVHQSLSYPPNQMEVFDSLEWQFYISRSYFAFDAGYQQGETAPELSYTKNHQERIATMIRLLHQPDSTNPKFKPEAIRNFINHGGKPAAQALHETGYSNLAMHLVPDDYVLEDPDALIARGIFPIPKPDAERDLYLAETLHEKIPSYHMNHCISNEPLFRKLHSLGARGDFNIIRYILAELKCDNATRYKTLRLAYSLGCHNHEILSHTRIDLSPDVMHYLLKKGCSNRDENGAVVPHRIINWGETTLTQTELVELHEMGYHWNSDHLRAAIYKDNVALIAAAHLTQTWTYRTPAILWAIAGRAQACFEYLVFDESLPFATKAFVFRNGRRTDRLNDNIPTDWLCLAYYMPWVWLVDWIKERASPELLDKIAKNTREWTHTWGLDKLIPPGWHDIRNFIAKNLAVDGRPQIMRALIAGRALPTIATELGV